MNFKNLGHQIQQLHNTLCQSAVRAVNTNLTIRNWLIGFYIVEFEQNGTDRAEYGKNLLVKLAKLIDIKGLSSPELSRCRQFYQTYPAILGSLTQEFRSLLPDLIFGSLTQKLPQEIQHSKDSISDNYHKALLSKISFTHFVELIKIKDSDKRQFYELLVIRNTLSVRELERQISTMSYERMGLAGNKSAALKELEHTFLPENTNDAIRSVYFFDFLNLPSNHLISESQLEEALITHLEQFILELGVGFCFEARQKRILIDDEYCFVDLVFYHRILKCHVLIDLKTDKFNHSYLSQLNSYVAYFNEEVIQPDDNPTIGILLCTEKGKKMVEYALAGMTQQLFVSKYLLELPSKELLSDFIQNELRNF